MKRSPAPRAQAAFNHVRDGVLAHLPAGDGAECAANARPQQFEVVVDLGDRAHGGPAAPGRHFLLHGDGGGQVVDAIDVRFSSRPANWRT